ncbi:MAG: DegT/DnrJ/EryC1/StrS family aminotransferase [Deltaproteobacteria bacterium]|nr:DegT/DnrJ/EryC1/StrS family aminotransferase [Deltaproteobacteria bacterium]
MNVPFLDLKGQCAAIRGEIAAAIGRVLDEAAFAGGPFVKRFEEEFGAFCDTRHCVGVGNGTDALWTALLAFGIGPGDEVITVPNTFIATAEAISFCGARPVFVDVDPATCTMAPALVEQAITARTKAVIPVHLFGQAADMDPIVAIARKHGLVVIEDACQAHGAQYRGRPAGSLGDAGCFSFYPGKNLGAYGEAGAVVTAHDGAAQKMRMFREHGQPKKYFHDLVGWNCRMDGMQAAVLSVKLKFLPAWNEARRENAALYGQLLAGLPDIELPYEAPYGRHVYHIYAIRTHRREALAAALGKRGIATGIHYPVPLHLTGAYRHLGYGPGSFPASERIAGELLSLPMFPELNGQQIDYVAWSVRRFMSVRERGLAMQAESVYVRRRAAERAAADHAGAEAVDREKMMVP